MTFLFYLLFIFNEPMECNYTIIDSELAFNYLRSNKCSFLSPDYTLNSEVSVFLVRENEILVFNINSSYGLLFEDEKCMKELYRSNSFPRPVSNQSLSSYFEYSNASHLNNNSYLNSLVKQVIQRFNPTRELSTESLIIEATKKPTSNEDFSLMTYYIGDYIFTNLKTYINDNAMKKIHFGWGYRKQVEDYNVAYYPIIFIYENEHGGHIFDLSEILQLIFERNRENSLTITDLKKLHLEPKELFPYEMNNIITIDNKPLTFMK